VSSTEVSNHLYVGKPSQCVTSYSGQLSLASLPCIDQISTSKSCELNRHAVTLLCCDISVLVQTRVTLSDVVAR